MDVLSPYIADGLRNGERCFCAQTAQVIQRLIYDLRFIGLNPEREIARGALELHTQDEVYYPSGLFDPAGLMDRLLAAIDDAHAKGFTGLRTAGEMSWASSGRGNCDQVLEYEKMVEERFPGKRALGICQYNVEAFEPSLLGAVLNAHRMQLDHSTLQGSHRSVQLRIKGWSAEIVASNLTLDPSYYYVVEKPGRREVLGWGVASDLECASIEAERMVHQEIQRVSSVC